MKRALTYDDVNIVPKYSDIERRNNVDIRTRFTKNTEIAYPVVSSPMDTVTGLDMAKEMLEWGTCGVIHRFQSIEEQSKMMKEVWKIWDSWFDISKNIGGDNEERTTEKEFNEWWENWYQ